MEAQKNAQKMVSHTTWAPQQTLPTFTPNPTFVPNPSYAQNPAFAYQPQPLPWQNPFQPTNSAPPQAVNHPPPPIPTPKEENPSTQTALLTFGMIMPIVGGSSLDFENKRQRRDYFRQVHSILVDGPVVKTQWSHIPITFSEQDVNLLSYPHSNAMVIEANIQGWTIGKSLQTQALCQYHLLQHLRQNEHDRKLLQPT
jgi:hypothetical protein